MKKRGAWLLGLAAAVWLTTPASVLAQATTGTILGTVKDGTGAAVPGVQVTATNLGTNFARSVTTDPNGQFMLTLLPLGAYKVEASASGFKGFVQSGVVLEVGRNARVDPVLEVGAFEDTLVITADAPLVETSTAALGRTVTQAEIANLPLVNRNAYDLLDLTAGVDRSEHGNTFGYSSEQTTINGSADAGTGGVNYYLDGGSNVGGLRNTGNQIPNPDAIQEFRVVTNSFSAEFGRFGGGAVDVITKSGTNTLHGSLFEFFRDDGLNAKRWTPEGISLKDPLRRHQFGATLGGPLKASRTFFFTSYSGLRQDSTRFKNTAVVPTALERAGNFSASARKPVNPDTKLPFPDATIPLGRFDPAAKAILERFIPQANLPNNGFQVELPQPLDSDELQLKLDHNLNAGQQLTASYFYFTREEVMPLNGAGNVPWNEQAVSSKQHNLNLTHNWILSASTVNTLRATYVRMFASRVNTPTISLADLGSRYVIQGPPSLPVINVTGFFNLNNAIGGRLAGSNLYMLRDVLTLSRGRHSLKLGGELSLEKMIHDTLLNNYGSFAFDGTKTGNAFADFLLGLPRTFDQDAPIYKVDNAWYFALFAQDDLRVSSRLTLNLGLRYDLALPLVDPLDRKLTFVQGRQSKVVPTAPPGLLFPGDDGVGRGIVSTDRNNISPRLGLAWDPAGDGRTAVRAGFGIYYSSFGGNTWNQTADQQPFTTRQRFNNPGTLSNPYSTQPGGLSPFPYDYAPSSPRFIFPASIHGPNLDYELPYTYQMNLSLQRQLARNLSVNVAYVGALGRKFPISPDINYPLSGPGASATNVDQRRPILPGTLGRITIIEPLLATDYHGLQVSAEKRGRSFTMKAYYSFAKGLEDAGLQGTQITGIGGGGVQNWTKLAAERARNGNDRRHNAVVSAIWKIDYFDESNALVKTLFNDWTLSAIGMLRSGEFFTVTVGRDNNLDGVNNDRPNLVGDPKLDGRSRNEQVNRGYFNTAAFATPAAGQDGDAGRNIIEGPGIRRVDLGLFRDFKLKGRAVLQFRVEANNAFNMVSFNNPESAMTAANFGKIRTAREMRELQFGARLSF